MRHAPFEHADAPAPAKAGFCAKLFGRAKPAESPAGERWWDEVIDGDRVGAFLKWNALPATSANYALAQALLAGGEAPAAEDAATEDEAAALVRLAEQASLTLNTVTAIVTRSREDVRHYGEALESRVAAFAEPSAASEALGALVELTRAMIARNLRAEERLREMGAEIETLRDSLAEARTSARHDVLTGLPNRRALEERLHHAIEAAGAIVVALCDIDHFKDINDRHGHDTGDRTLRLVADALAREAGSDCTVGRYGGEEFLMLFEGVDLDTVFRTVDTIRGDLARRNLRNRDTDEPIGHVTFSAGIAAIAPGENGETLIRRADTALYQAKRDGRNRVAIDRVAAD